MVNTFLLNVLLSLRMIPSYLAAIFAMFSMFVLAVAVESYAQIFVFFNKFCKEINKHIIISKLRKCFNILKSK